MSEVFNSNFDLNGIQHEINVTKPPMVEIRLSAVEAAFLSELLAMSQQLELMDHQNGSMIPVRGSAQVLPVSGSEELTDDIEYCDDDTCVCLLEDAPDFEASMNDSINEKLSGIWTGQGSPGNTNW